MAQDFDPRGRHGRTPPSAVGRQGRSPSSAGATRAGAPSSQQLIERYTRIVLSLADSSAPLEKLAQAYRQRDGNIASLITDFERLASQEGTSQYAALVALGGIYRLDHRPSDAATAYAKAVTLRPHETSAPLALARFYRDSGDVPNARATYESVLALQASKTDRQQTLRALMVLSLDEKDWSAAKRYHSMLAALDPADLFVRGELGRELESRGEFVQAERELQELVASARGDNRALAPALKELGRAQAKCHERDKAIATLKGALAAAGGQPALQAEIYEVLAEVYRADQDLPALIAELAGSHPVDSARLALLGRLYEETGDSGKAIESFMRALAFDPRQVDLRLRLVRLLQARGDLDRAVAEYSLLLRFAPNNPQLVFEACDAMIERGDRARALRLVTDMEARSGGDEELLSRVADYYARVGEAAQSLRVLQRLAGSGRADPQNIVDLGDRYFHDGKVPLALQTWRRLLSVVQPRSKALSALGDVFVEHDMGSEALAAYKEALALDPSALATKKALAGLYERNREYGSAVTLYEEIAQMATSKGDRGLARESRSRIVGLWGLEHVLERQVPGLLRAFAGPPVDVDVGRMLADAELHLGRPAQAEAALRRILEIEPGDAESYKALERVLIQQHKQGEAIDVLEKLTSVEPNRAREVYERMARYALEIYRDDDAMKYSARAVELNPDDADAHRRLGEMYRARQDIGHAISELRAAIAKNDRLFVVYLELADLLLSSGQADDADALLRQVVRSSTDEDVVMRAAKLAMQLEGGSRSPGELERDLLPLALSRPDRPLYRRLLVEVYATREFALTERIRHGQSQDAAAARSELSRMGDRALKPLVDALTDTDVGQQRIAVDALSYVQNINAGVPLFAFATGSSDPALRTRAMMACGTLNSPALIPKYAVLLFPSGGRYASDVPESLALAAVWGLARNHDRGSIPLLRRVVREGSESAQAIAAIGLGLAGDKASIGDLVTLLRGGQAGGAPRAGAVFALGELDAEDQVPTLIETAAEGDSLTRRVALWSLARMVARSRVEPPWKDRAISVMADAVFSPDRDPSATAMATPSVSISAVTSLALLAMGERGRDRLPITLSVPDGPLDVEAWIGSVVSGEPSNAERETALIRYSDAIERAAVNALHTSAARARMVIDAIAGGDGCLRHFVGADGSSPAAERARAIARAIEPSLPALARGPDVALRTAALLALAKTDSEAVDSALADAIESQDDSVRRVALVSVSSPGSGGSHAHAQPRSLAAVANVLGFANSWSLRMLAAQAMGRFGLAGAYREARVRLSAAATGDAYALVREAALDALDSFDPSSARELASHMASSDPEPRVREVASAMREH